MLNPTIHSFKYGKHSVVLEAGVIARQSDISVLVNMSDTVVLVTLVCSKQTTQTQSFFPLNVIYQERSYAAGRIPNGFLRREGRPSESEIIISRLIDRPIRPLFPPSFLNEVQIITTVLSLNPQVTTDIVSLIGVSAALSLSELPFNGPFGAARVCYINNKYILSSDITDQTATNLDLIVVGSSNSILMVEAQPKLLNEQQILDAIIFGYKEQQIIINNINELVRAPCNKRTLYKRYISNIEAICLKAKTTKLAEVRLYDSLQTESKKERFSSIGLVKTDILNNITASRIHNIVFRIEKNIMRKYIIKTGLRIDGRNKNTVRNLWFRIGFLPRVHGSALFTRGETQALVAVTLGTQRNAQNVEELIGGRIDQFLFHYNFPPFCVGEVGIVNSPKRREVGHGLLAKRSLLPVIPDFNAFPYTIRIVSEITESNGSSSMASVCGASLALMDAGVPIDSPAAGVSIGLIKETNSFILLSDILGDEDQLGDMDLKTSGTKAGITAIQMDIKIQEGINKSIIALALKQARNSICFILAIMNKSISSSRKTICKYAPKIYSIKISPDKIKRIVGKGGSIIKSLTEETNTTIDISTAGIVTILASNDNMANNALTKIKELTSDIKIGSIYSSKVTRIVEFGVYVSFCGYKEGLVHISQISNKYISKVTDHLKLNQEVLVKVLDIDRFGKIKLSIKEAV